MLPINMQICFDNEELINVLVHNVLGDFIDAGLRETLDAIIDAITTLDDNCHQDSEIDDVVEEVVESMMSVVCGDASAGGDALSPELQPVQSTATSEEGPLGDVARDVNERSTPAKGPEVFNTFGELVGWLDPGAIPVLRAPRRRNPFSAAWIRVKRVIRGLCCCRSVL